MSENTAVSNLRDHISSEAEAKVVNKVIWRVLPLLTFAFVLAYIDRTNVGFAALTMNEDLGLTESQFGFGAGLLFFSYCLLEVPSNALLYRFGARRWLARIMVTWGILTIATAWISGPYSFYALRLLLGAAEAGFTPGGMFYLSQWVPRQYRGRVVAAFQLAVPLASLISGPLSGTILELNGVLGLAGWQWLFILTGVPAAIVGVVILITLSDSPAEAKWLSAEERDIITRLVNAETRERPVQHLKGALLDGRVLLLSMIQLGFTIGAYGITLWLPQILKSHHLSNVAVGWFAALPYLFGCIATIVWAFVVDRTGQRAANLAIACALGAVGLLISLYFGSLEWAMTGMCLALIGITSARGIFWSIPSRFLTGMGAAAGLAFINSIGTFGGFIGPSLMGWLKTVTGTFTSGLAVLAALTAASAALSLFMVRRLPPG